MRYLAVAALFVFGACGVDESAGVTGGAGEEQALTGPSGGWYASTWAHSTETPDTCQLDGGAAVKVPGADFIHSITDDGYVVDSWVGGDGWDWEYIMSYSCSFIAPSRTFARCDFPEQTFDLEVFDAVLTTTAGTHTVRWPAPDRFVWQIRDEATICEGADCWFFQLIFGPNFFTPCNERAVFMHEYQAIDAPF